MSDGLLEELVSAMSAERQEVIARRTAELLDLWRAFEPAPLPPFDASTVALSWLALARDAVAEIRRVRVAPPDEAIPPEVIAVPSADAGTTVEDAHAAEQPASLTDAAPEGEPVPLVAADEADTIVLDAGIAIAAAISGGSIEDEPVLAVIPPALSTDIIAAEAEAESEIVPLEEAIALDDDDLAFPMLSPFEGDDASAALARAVREGLALRTDGKPKTGNSDRVTPMTVHPGAFPSYMGPPTSGTRLSSP
ncbi:conserved hypothetical protein [Hyphomicrobiales bacterium]|nr:conserved hypothetical protein [Hyphomicrobiales bacterium]CAH1663739.1 conserved hypothetical protein [Hyphomicrobiales bacterium]